MRRGEGVYHHTLDIQRARVGILQAKTKKIELGERGMVELCVTGGFDWGHE